MGIEVPNDQCIGGAEIEDWMKVWREARGTGGSGWDVNVQDLEVEVVEVKGDPLKLYWRVCGDKLVGVQVGELEAMVHQQRKAPPAISRRAIPSDHGVAWKGDGLGGRSELSLLERCHNNVVFLQKVRQLTRAMAEAVAVKLQEGRGGSIIIQ